jgi:cytochrome c
MRLAILTAALMAVALPADAADAVRGEDLWQSRCFACHSLDADRVGPRHRGVYGRRAGSVPGFAYSPALATAGITWDAGTLARWLADPRAFVPGTKMTIRVADPADRADIIDYLRRESGR